MTCNSLNTVVNLLNYFIMTMVEQFKLNNQIYIIALGSLCLPCVNSIKYSGGRSQIAWGPPQRACMKRLMTVDKAKEECRDCSVWRSVLSDCLLRIHCKAKIS